MARAWKTCLAGVKHAMSRIQEFIKAHDYACWCGQRAARVFCRQMSMGRRFVVRECSDCRTQRILPNALNGQSSAETLYNEYNGPDFSEVDLEQFTKNILKRLRETQVSFGPGKKVLDIGCGNGVLLETICKQFGCVGTGIDVDQRRIAKARARTKHASFKCELFDGASLGEKYDIIISSAVIEHVVDPPGFLKQFHPALTDDGSLFLLTPNAHSLSYRLLRSWWRELLSIGEHIYLFTPRSLELCAGRAGFELVKLSSDFDRARLKFRADGFRNLLVSLWSIHCECVKRFSGCLASPQTGDILYAHFRKAKAG
jgi:2-polyprenyl-3-methyl-5-hydroxy-6-metoxy-1,4-benzoquinol methylase